MGKITKRSIDAITPEAREQFLWDSQLPGFGVRTSPKGRKTFIVQYRAGSRTRRLKLGVYGAITPDEARDLAKRTLSEVAQGEDPSSRKQHQRRAPNVSALCDRLVEEYAPSRCKPTTQREYERVCRKVIKPRLGAMKVHEVTRADIAMLHHDLRETPYQANRTLATLSKMFNLAELWELRPDGSNPTRHVQKYKEHKRERYLSPEEIETLFTTMDELFSRNELSYHVACAFKLLLLTGCRLSEVQKAKWSWIRGNVLVLPDSKTGTRRVMLSKSVLAIINTLPRLPNNPYLIVGESEGQHYNDLQKPWRRIRKEAGLEDVRIHDLRHTYASIAAAAGHSLPIIGKLLGHTQPQTTARYAHLADTVTRNAADDVDDMIGGFVGHVQQTPQQHLRLVTDE